MNNLTILFTVLAFVIICIVLYSCRPKNTSGEKSEIIFKDEKGNQISLTDLEGVTGKYDWEVEGDKNIPAEAIQLHREARQHGIQGDYASGIEKLQKARQLAPDWAYPVYDLAYTYLLQQDFPNALQYYRLTDEMEPKGFFTAKTAYWSLRKEAEGVFQQGAYLAYMRIEWMDSDEEKLQLAKMIVERLPAYAPAWEVIASKAGPPAERLQAVENGLAADPDAGTKGMLLINKALLSDQEGETEGAKKILGELIFSEEATFSNVEMAKFVLATLAKKK